MRFLHLLLALSLMVGGVAMAQDAGERPFLGISFSVEDDGALVRAVIEGSPAATAGLQVDDLILAVDGVDVAPEALAATIQALEAGATITLTLQRDGAELTLDVTLGSAPAPLMQWQAFRDSAYLGVSLVSDEAGVLVEDVVPESPAAEAGLEAGDLLHGIDGEAVGSPLEAARMIRALEAGSEITLDIERDGEAMSLAATIGSRPAIADAEGMRRTPESFRFRMDGGQPLLGVEYLDLNAEIAVERDLALDEGALILNVMPDSPAEAAGLLVDDVVIAVEGDPVDARRTLRERLLAYDPGETLQLELLRAGEAHELEVTLGAGTAGLPFRFHGFRGGQMPPGVMPDLEALQERFGEDVDVEALLEAMAGRLGRDFDMEAWLEQFELQGAQQEALVPAPDV